MLTVTALRAPTDYFYSARIVASHFILATGLKMTTLDRSTVARIGANPLVGENSETSFKFAF